MMVSPEWYYEEHLKGKTVEQITTTIRGLNREIGRLKKILEHPYYECSICPGEDVQLAMSVEYLERAKSALAEAGGVYVPTKEDQRIAEFNANLAHMKKITFEYGQSLGNTKIRTVKAYGDGLTLQISSGFSLEGESETIEVKDKQAFITCLQKLNIGGWRRYYDTYHYGVAVMDGDFWEVKISFTNGKRAVKFHGNNAYPYNFGKLQELFDEFWLDAGV